MWHSAGSGAPGCGVPNSADSSEGRARILGHHQPESDSTNINRGDKLGYDSHSDSGFLSGSNLMSSGSVDDYSHSSSNLASHHHLPSLPTSPTDNTNTLLTSSGCLDSGIDISEQFSSLQLRSGPINSYEESSNSHLTSAGDVTTEDPSDPSLTISRDHVTLLREIFSPDKDGDT